MASKKERITDKALALLAEAPTGIRFSDLVAQLQSQFPDDPYGTLTGTVWNLDARLPDDVYKPSRGLFRLTQYRVEPQLDPAEQPECVEAPENIKESAFYEPFADYLLNDLEECTKAIPLGGNKFGGKWGTPDVFGIFRSRESDIVKMPLEVIVAEVKLDAGQLIRVQLAHLACLAV